MEDLIKKTILAGLGVFSLTKTKAEELVDSLVKEGMVAKGKEADMTKDIIKKVEQSRDILEKKVENIVKNTMKKWDIPTRQEIKELKTKIDSLSKKLKS